MISVDLSQDFCGDVLDVTKQSVHSLITLRVTSREGNIPGNQERKKRTRVL